MNVLLIDVDSKIPNLALMKVSAYHKSKGDHVGFNVANPDLIYASVIFKKNRHLVDGLKFFYPDAKINIGGSGYDLKLKLPDEIELIKPDYSLYPECDYSIGFASRGCIRNCYFCIVPKKEGKFYITQHPKHWHNSDFDKIMFLDNNILADRDYFFEVSNWCIDQNLSVNFTQGLDIRLLDMGIAKQLLHLNIWKSLFFAWDNLKDEQLIREKIQILKAAGFTSSKLKKLVQFYVYVDSDQEYDTGVYRCRELKKLNCNAFVMFNIDHKRSDRIKALQRWANLKWVFWSCDLSEYSL